MEVFSDIGIAYIINTSDASVTNFGLVYFVNRSGEVGRKVASLFTASYYEIHWQSDCNIAVKNGGGRFCKIFADSANFVDDRRSFAKVLKSDSDRRSRTQWLCLVSLDAVHENISTLGSERLFHLIEGSAQNIPLSKANQSGDGSSGKNGPSRSGSAADKFDARVLAAIGLIIAGWLGGCSIGQDRPPIFALAGFGLCAQNTFVSLTGCFTIPILSIPLFAVPTPNANAAFPLLFGAVRWREGDTQLD